MSAPSLLPLVDKLRLFAVVRTDTADQAIAAAEACLRGGVRLLEITLTVPDALRVVSALARVEHAVVGVGSVVETRQVADAVHAGARFSVSPHFDEEILAEARVRGLMVSMGGCTPTEAMRCHRAGVDVVKIFPASSFGGPAHLKALREPMPFLRLMPTGGVDETNVKAYLEAGACAVGLGGSLIDKKAVAAGNWAAIEEKARALVKVVEDWAAARPAGGRV